MKQANYRCWFVSSLVLLLVTLASGALAQSARVSLNVVEAEFTEVLAAVAVSGGVELLIDETSVTKSGGKITLCLTNQPVAVALQLLAAGRGLVCIQQGDIYIIGSPDRLLSTLAPVRLFKLKYVSAATIKDTLAMLVPEERLKFDVINNIILLSGTEAEAVRLEQVLEKLDLPPRQVGLAAQVVAVNKSAMKDLGLEWQWSALPTVPEQTRRTTASSTTTTEETTIKRDFPGVIKLGHNPEGFANEFQFQARLNALITNGDAKILSRPEIVTLDGQQARILIGDRIPVLIERVENNRTTNTIEYVDAGIKLLYTPRINEEGIVTASVTTEVSTPTLVAEMKAYRITTREAQTHVRMRSGETLVIGGLIATDESSRVSRVPGLDKLPVLGALFRNSRKIKNETEVVIMLTATIID